jgi:hypothetical protein
MGTGCTISRVGLGGLGLSGRLPSPPAGGGGIGAGAASVTVMVGGDNSSTCQNDAHTPTASSSAWKASDTAKVTRR